MAPPKTGDTETVVEGLKQVYQDIAALMLMPDAGQYSQPIQQLQQAVLKMIQGIGQQKAQQAAQMQQMQAQRAMQGGQMGAPQAGGPQPGMMQRPGPPPGGPPGAPAGAGSPGMAMPNPDELRRVLAQSGQGGQ